MKIKRFAGYGSVNATKISSRKYTNPYGETITEIKIRVRGNHERGIQYNDWDSYGASNWLLTNHFMKGFNPNDVIKFTTQDWYEKLPNGIDEEVCDYTFLVR